MARSPEPPCAVCSRPARGFGWFDPAPRKKPRPSVCFCGIACQTFWSRLAGRSSAVVDLTEQEQAAMRAADRVIVAADASKLGRVQLINVAPVSAISILVTDGPATHPAVEALRTAGVSVVCVNAERAPREQSLPAR